VPANDTFMPSDYTLTIIKPDAVARQLTGRIIAHLEGEEFRISAARVLHLTEAEASAFYEVHRERPFFGPLVAFMTSGPCMPMVLSRRDAVLTLRRVIGATDPREAAPGTVRQRYAESKERNAIHASDSDDNAAREARFFFAETEILQAR
jgi:nucleoside-diphosphate kinase